MRTISSTHITETVARLCQEANVYLGDDVLTLFRQARTEEVSEIGPQGLEGRMTALAVHIETHAAHTLCQSARSC